jgi:hypothetical protein
MWSPPDLGMGGRRGDQLMLQAGRRGGGLERWKSACLFWRAPKIMGARPQIMGARPHSERAPKNNGGAPSFRGRFGDFLLFFMQLRVDDF